MKTHPDGLIAVLKRALSCATAMMALNSANAGQVVTTTFSNASTITILTSSAVSPYVSAADPFPSTIAVAFPSLTKVLDVSMTVHGFNHAYPEDVDMVLADPTGKTFSLWSDAGTGLTATNLTIKLDDSAAAALPNSTPLVSGTFRPADFLGGGFSLLNPAAPIGTGTFANTFAGTNPNGVWALYILDDSGNDSGSITSGWSLELTVRVPTPDDVDNDGIRNRNDPDIDGDGQRNGPDRDADGDRIPDRRDRTPKGVGGGRANYLP